MGGQGEEGFQQESSPPRFCVLGAMEGEVQEILFRMKETRPVSWNGFTFWEGELEGAKTVVGHTGVGKSMAAMVTQHILDMYSVKTLFYTGIAGALHPDLRRGDILIAEDCGQYDLYVGKWNIKRGQVPLTKYRFLASSLTLLELAGSFHHPEREGQVKKGRILTGDTFVHSKGGLLPGDKIFTSLKGDAVDMEGASAALVAEVNEVPFLLFRVISDRGEGRIPGGLKKFLNKASFLSAEFVIHMIRRLKD